MLGVGVGVSVGVGTAGAAPLPPKKGDGSEFSCLGVPSIKLEVCQFKLSRLRSIVRREAASPAGHFGFDETSSIKLH